MQQILLHIVKEATSHIDIMSHFQKENSLRWCNLVRDNCRVFICIYLLFRLISIQQEVLEYQAQVK